MNDIQVQEKQIYSTLNPLFTANGYELIPYQKQFKMPSSNGFRAALIAVSGNRNEQTIDLTLGIRLDLVEELVQQFLGAQQAACPLESSTLAVSYNRVNQQPYQRFLVNDEEDLEAVCRRIEEFMSAKGFRFLERFDNLKKVDALLNRTPDQCCPYLFSQVHRCFRGIILAKLTSRSNFNHLAKTYLSYLKNQWAPHSVIANFKRLVKFLRYYSVN